MAINKRDILIGFITVFLLASGVIYLNLEGGNAQIRIDKDKSVFYSFNETSNRWLISGTEYNSLFDGTTKLYRSVSDITLEYFYMNNDSAWIELASENMTELPASNIKVVRTTPYSRGPVIIDTYYFDGSVSNIELFPISHEVNILNGDGYIYQYEVRDLIYDGETIKDVSSPMSFGRNMKVEWDDRNYWSTVYASGILKVRYKPDSDNVTYNVRLFDPLYVKYNVTDVTYDTFVTSGDPDWCFAGYDFLRVGFETYQYIPFTSSESLIEFDISDLLSYRIISSESTLMLNLKNNFVNGSELLSVDALMVYENWTRPLQVTWNNRPTGSYLSPVLDSYNFTQSDLNNTWYSFNITDAVSRSLELNLSKVTILLRHYYVTYADDRTVVEFYSSESGTGLFPHISTILNINTFDIVINSSRTFPTLAYETDDLMGYCSANTTLSLPYNKIYYKWYKNGTLNKSGSISGTFNGSQEYYVTNLSSPLTIGDNYIFSCLAGDELENSSWINSSIVTVSNSSLSDLNLSIAGFYSNITAEIGDTILTGTANSHDVCIDVIGYENGTNISCGVNLTSCLFKPTYFTKSPGETYYMTYTTENTNKTFNMKVLKGDIPTNITFNIHGSEYDSSLPSGIKVYAGDTLITIISTVLPGTSYFSGGSSYLNNSVYDVPFLIGNLSIPAPISITNASFNITSIPEFNSINLSKNINSLSSCNGLYSSITTNGTHIFELCGLDDLYFASKSVIRSYYINGTRYKDYNLSTDFDGDGTTYPCSSQGCSEMNGVAFVEPNLIYALRTDTTGTNYLMYINLSSNKTYSVANISSNYINGYTSLSYDNATELLYISTDYNSTHHIVNKFNINGSFNSTFGYFLEEFSDEPVTHLVPYSGKIYRYLTNPDKSGDVYTERYNLDGTKDANYKLLFNQSDPYTLNRRYTIYNGTWYMILSNGTLMTFNKDYYPLSPKIEIGIIDGIPEWSYSSYYNSNTNTGNLTESINNYVKNCTPDDFGNYNVPIYIIFTKNINYPITSATFNLTNLDIDYKAESFNPIVINSTVISNYIDNNSGYWVPSLFYPNYINLPINISSATKGKINATNVTYNAISENETFDIMVHLPDYSQNLTRRITFYHSPYDLDMPPKISQMDFYPSRPTSTNVVPFGQKSSVPFYNITSYNYGGKTANLSLYLKSPIDYIVDSAFVENTYSFTYPLPLERLPGALETRVNNWSNIDLITCFNGTDYTKYDPDSPLSATCNSIDSGDILIITLKKPSFFSITKGQFGIDENTWFTYSGDYAPMPNGIKNIISNWSDVESIVCKDASYVTRVFNTSLPASENNLTYIDYGYNCTINLTSSYPYGTFNIYYPYAPVKCVDLILSNTSSKAEGTSLPQDTWVPIMTGLIPETNLGLWFWADYNCTYDDFFVWYPDIYLRMCAEGTNYCSKELI